MEQSTMEITVPTNCETACKSSSVIVGMNNGKVKVFPLGDNENPEMENQSRQSCSEGFIDSENIKERREVLEQGFAETTTEVEDCIRSLESDTDFSGASTSFAESQPICIASHWKAILRIWKQRSMRRLYTFPPKVTRRIHGLTRDHSSKCKPPEAEFCYLRPSWKNFTFSELNTATNHFSPENLIGKGGYAEVYRGCLQDGQLVAIKKLTRGTSEDRGVDFLSELGIIVHIDHPNAARLIGFGVEGGMHLVLKLSPHGSLASLLHGSKQKLDWSIRYKIALGTAEGLLYLHEGCKRRIIHRDIKASNILLTEDFEPQISDFGLAKWLPDQWTHHTVSKFEGTFGYLAPEYFMHGIVDEKTDVFAFGVVLLELITGRRAVDPSQRSLVMLAKPLLEKNDIKELADPTLGDDYDSHQMSRAVLTASACIQHSSIQRPKMSQVVRLMKGEEGSLESMKQHQQPHLQRTYSVELYDADEYNSTKYLNDLNRHMQLAMEF